MLKSLNYRWIVGFLLTSATAAAYVAVRSAEMAMFVEYGPGKAIVNVFMQDASNASNILALSGLALIGWTLRDRRFIFESSFARSSVIYSVGLVIAVASGFLVTISGSFLDCQDWLLCQNGLSDAPMDWGIIMAHRLIVGFAGLLLAGMFINAWRSQRFQRTILLLTTLTATLFLSLAIFDGALAAERFASETILLRAFTTSALVLTSLGLLIAVGLAGRTVESERLDAYQKQPIAQRLKDFLALTKPIIVVLLLVTTFTGMVVGAGAWPDGATVFWTLLGGALAAGGSGAINQYIDRDVDKRMKRTARRPVASGRMAPAEALAYGVGLCVLAFYLLAVFVNLLAALLSVVGMIYYVWIYSILLCQERNEKSTFSRVKKASD